MTRLVVVSNRVPAPTAAGAQAGGLAVALQSLMQQRGGLWFGWSGKVSDSPAVRLLDDGSVRFATTDLTADEHNRFLHRVFERHVVAVAALDAGIDDLRSS